MNVGIRIAIRHEGGFINAYMAQPETLEGAVLLGSIAVAPAQHPLIFAAWKKLMGAVLMTAAVDAGYGLADEPVEQEPPDHERTRDAG